MNPIPPPQQLIPNPFLRPDGTYLFPLRIIVQNQPGESDGFDDLYACLHIELESDPDGLTETEAAEFHVVRLPPGYRFDSSGFHIGDMRVGWPRATAELALSVEGGRMVASHGTVGLTFGYPDNARKDIARAIRELPNWLTSQFAQV